MCLCALDGYTPTDCSHFNSYDLLNEPLPGNFYNNPSLVYPGNADLYVLQPMCATHSLARSLQPILSDAHATQLALPCRSRPNTIDGCAQLLVPQLQWSS